MGIAELAGLRVGVATVRGRPYYRFAAALRRIGVRFDSILPGDIPEYAGDAVLTTRGEAPAAARERSIVTVYGKRGPCGAQVAHWNPSTVIACPVM